MSELDRFIDEISQKYKDSFSEAEIKSILGYDAVFEDMPISTGKRLIIKYLKVIGYKKNGDQIDFQKEFGEGVNIIIADNLKGKSTTFKIIKAALVGDVSSKSIKADVKQWINNITLGFKINEKDYTIEINLEGRFKGNLYNIHWSDFLINGSNCDNVVFKSSDNKTYVSEIQKFFFNQFSYYSLKWTQKSSQKESNKLVEAGASWKTYYKSIYLESKDSGSFYGGQEQKVFQMLLGLENTYLINHLNVKKEKLQFEIAKEKEYESKTLDGNKSNKRVMELRLNEIQKELDNLKNNDDMKDLLQLQREHNIILENMNKNNKEIVNLSDSYKIITAQRGIKLDEIELYKLEKRRVEREITRNKKLVIDLKEYIEIDKFFSNLNIKCCPSCNHDVKENKIKDDVHICPLCNEEVEKDDKNKDNYISKIENLEKLLNSLEIDKNLIEEKITKLNIELKEINTNISLVNDKIKILEKQNIKEDFITLSSKIEKIKEHNNNYDEEILLIEERAILKYKVDNLNDDNENIKAMDDKLSLITEASEFLNNKRYEKSKNILNTLEKIMLNEIHEFGLKSITDINIDDKFNITYIQNGLFVKFDNIAEGEQLRVKLAFYLALIQMDIEKNFGRHTRFLIIDSPNKEEGDFTYLEGLKEVLLNIDRRYRNNLQIIIGTATRELENVLENQTVYPKGEYVF